MQMLLLKYHDILSISSMMLSYYHVGLESILKSKSRYLPMNVRVEDLCTEANNWS